MGEGEPQAVLPGPRKELRHGSRRDLLALVGVEEEGPALLPLHLLPAHRDLVELGDEEASKERGVLFADRSLGEPGEKDLALVHDGAQVQPALAGADDLAHGLRAQEAVETGEDRAHALPGRQSELVPEV